MAKKRAVAAKKPKKTTTAKKRTPVSKAKATRKLRAAGSSASRPTNARQARFASLQEAKNAVVDTLIERIEESERRLSAAKRANSIDELEQLSQGLDD